MLARQTQIVTQSATFLLSHVHTKADSLIYMAAALRDNDSLVLPPASMSGF